MHKRKRAGNTITRKINSTKDTAAKADKNHYISNSYLEGFIPIDTEYFTASPILVLIVWVFCFCFLFYDFARSIGGIISIISFKDYFCCSTAFFTTEI